MSETSDKGTEMLADLPPYLADDPYARALVDAVAREVQRIDDYVAEVSEYLRPHAATGDWLSLWERVMGLPVAPDASEATRRTVLVAAIRRRTAGAGEGWGDLLTALIGSGGWSVTENYPSAYEVEISVPIDQTTYRAGAIQDFLRVSVPAHLDWTVDWTVGDFRVGSEVGDIL